MGIATADRVYGPGDAIYNEGEYGDALYVLTQGVMKLFRPYSGSKEATLRLLKPWDIFGHLAFAGEARQRAYAEAVTECRVTKVPKVFVERAVRQEPRAAFKLMTLLELRLVQYEELVQCLLPRETEVRLANLLPLLAQKFGESNERPRHHRPPPHPPGPGRHGRLHPRIRNQGPQRDAQPRRDRGRFRPHHPQRHTHPGRPERR